MEGFIGEIRWFGFKFAPQGWHLCDGAVMQITQNQALYSLLGVNYGGDGRATFQLPDLRGRTPIGVASTLPLPPGVLQAFAIGAKGGAESVTLNATQTPQHMHSFAVTTVTANQANPATATENNLIASPETGHLRFASGTPNAPMGDAQHPAMSSSGGNAPHNNMQPFLVLNACIAVTGLYPTRS